MKKKWIYVAGVNEFPLREGKRALYDGHDVAIFHLADGFYAIQSVCPHKQGPLQDGIVSGRTVFCPLHNWQFSVENGQAVSGGEGCIKTYPVKVQDEKVYVAFEDGCITKAQDSSACIH